MRRWVEQWRDKIGNGREGGEEMVTRVYGEGGAHRANNGLRCENVDEFCKNERRGRIENLLLKRRGNRSARALTCFPD